MQYQTLRSVSDHHGYVICRDVEFKASEAQPMGLGLGGMTNASMDIGSRSSWIAPWQLQARPPPGWEKQPMSNMPV
jgi:hypothetical protein